MRNLQNVKSIFTKLIICLLCVWLLLACKEAEVLKDSVNTKNKSLVPGLRVEIKDKSVDFELNEMGFVKFRSDNDFSKAVSNRADFLKILSAKYPNFKSKVADYLAISNKVEQFSSQQLEDVFAQNNEWLILKKDEAGFKDSTLIDDFLTRQNAFQIGNSYIKLIDGQFYESNDVSVLTKTSADGLTKLKLFELPSKKNGSLKNKKISATCTSMYGIFTANSTRRGFINGDSYVFNAGTPSPMIYVNGQPTKIYRFQVDVVAKMQKKVLGIWWYYTPSNQNQLYSVYGYNFAINGNTIAQGNVNTYQTSYDYQVGDYFGINWAIPTNEQGLPRTTVLTDSYPNGKFFNWDLLGAYVYYTCP